MDWLKPAVTATLLGSIVLTAIYAFLYAQEKKRFLLVWTIGWLVYCMRFVFILAGLTVAPSPWLTILNHTSTLVSGMLLLWGTHEFSGKRFRQTWWIAAVAGILWIGASTFRDASLLQTTLPIFTFLAAVYIWTGVTLIRTRLVAGASKYLTGGTLILWGLHKADFPLLRSVPWFAPWGFMLGAAFELIVSMGMLIVYFEATRAELVDAQSRFREIAERIREVFWIGSSDWREVYYVSPIYEEIWGQSCQSLYADPLSWVNGVHPEDQETIHETVNRHSHGTYEVIEFPEYRVVHPDGRIRWILARAYPVTDSNGQVVRLAGIAEDITRRKEAEKATRQMETLLREQQKLESIGTLASGVAHEINNPLTGMINYAELIKDRVASQDRVLEYSTEIIREGNRIAEIVKNLLSFSRRDDATYGEERIASIVERTVSLLRTSLLKDQITLLVDIPEDLPPVVCQSQQIQQVLVNLLTNAQASLNERFPGFDESKRLEVSATTLSKVETQWIRISVEDSGLGVPQAIRDRIFDPFFTSKPRDQGTGLGLSISHGIIADHGGTISLETEEGAYARFHVDLPLRRDVPNVSR